MASSEQDRSSPLRLGGGPPRTFADPQNEFEEALIQLSRKELPVQKFLEKFFNSSVYVLLPEGQVTNIGDQVKLVPHPRVFALERPGHDSVCVYSHPSRAHPTRELYPDFKFEYEVTAGTFLFGIEGSVGVAINPYWDINFEWSNHQLAAMKEQMRRQTPEPDCGQEPVH